MRSDGLPRHLLIAFICALGGYIFFFACDQYIRVRKGPWQVQFTQTNQTPLIIVSQPGTAIANVRILFEGDAMTNSANGAVVSFDKPLKGVPFGEVLFEDLTYLPGSVAFNFFGHQVELLPRTLIINRKEIPWTSNQSYIVSTNEKLAEFKVPKKMDRQRRYRELRQAESAGGGK
ncbi:MAG: hypothetical protein ACO1QB_05485 [Verrucomicrobiales bacterium]